MESLVCTAELVNVTKVFSRSENETIAVNNVSFKACKGEFVLLLGPSGSGKTTLLTMLAGLQRPTSGEVFVFGKRVQDYSAMELQQLRARKIGFIFQTFCLLDNLTVIDNVTLVMKFAGVRGKRTRNHAIECLNKFGVDHLRNEYPDRLSQGEKQRVAVARAISNGASMILADEPTGSLATEQGMAIIEFLHKGVRSEGINVVVASHDERIAAYADHVHLLRDGHLA